MSLAVVFGTTGNVGSGIARSLLKAGWKVAAPVRDAARVPSYLSGHPSFSAVVRPIDTLDGMVKSLEDINTTYGAHSITSVVASFGGMGPWGRVTALPLDTLEHALDAQIRSCKPHIYAWRVFGGQLVQENRAGTSYIVVTGGGMLAGSIGVTGIIAGLQVGTAREAIFETSGSNLRVVEACLSFMVKEDEAYEQAVRDGSAHKAVRPSSLFGGLVAGVVNHVHHGGQVSTPVLNVDLGSLQTHVDAYGTF